MKSNFAYIRNKKEYLSFIDSISDDFGGIEYTIDVFGIDLKRTEDEFTEDIKDYDGEIKYLEPDSYPAIIYYNHLSGQDRLGKYENMVFDFITIEEMNLKIADDSNVINHKKYNLRLKNLKDKNNPYNIPPIDYCINLPKDEIDLVWECENCGEIYITYEDTCKTEECRKCHCDLCGLKVN